MIEPTKQEVFGIAEYLKCDAEELWSEVAGLLCRQHNYAVLSMTDKIKKLIDLQKETHLEINGRPDCKNCTLIEELEGLLRAMEKRLE